MKFLSLFFILAFVWSALSFNISFVSLPARGHVSPAIPVALELVKQGHKVTFLLPKFKVTEFVKGYPEIEIRWLGDIKITEEQVLEVQQEASRKTNMLEALQMSSNLFRMAEEFMFSEVLTGLADTRPDAVMCDTFCFACHDAADKLGIPIIGMHSTYFSEPFFSGITGLGPWLYAPTMLTPPRASPSFLDRTFGLTFSLAMDWLMKSHFLAARNQARATNGLPPVSSIMGSSRASASPITTIVPSFFGFETARPLPPFIHMVGPLSAAPVHSAPLAKDLRAWLDNGGPFVYVAFGTVVDLNPSQCSTLARAFADLYNRTGLRVLWSLPSKQQASCLPPSSTLLPSAILRFESFVDQPKILAHENIRSYVFHCGANSLTEAVLAAVPVVGIPFLGDQPVNCGNVAYQELGRALFQPGAFSSHTAIADSIMEVSTQPKYKTRMNKVSKLAKSSGGAKQAARAIVDTMEHGTEHLALLSHDAGLIQAMGGDVVCFVACLLAMMAFAVAWVVKRAAVWCLSFSNKKQREESRKVKVN